jgi:CDP-4-dehydro-6-deoxyglucose reductase
MLMKDGKRRSFSMANAPHADQFLELHVRKTPGGAFSRYVFEEMKERAILRFEGPLGTFYLREDSDKPIIFVAGGTGSRRSRRRSSTCSPRRRPADRALLGRARKEGPLPSGTAGRWARDHPNFSYIPVLSDATPEDAWTGVPASCTKPFSTTFPTSPATRSTRAGRRR